MRQMRFWGLLRVAGLVALAISSSACSTHTVHLKYEPTVELVSQEGSVPTVVVGAIRDERGEDSAWFGAIRGGYGNPLKKLYADQSIDAVVSSALSDALRSRQMLASTQTEATIRIDGTVRKLDCNYYWNRDAHADIQINVVEIASSAVLYSQTYKTDSSEGGVGAGVFGSVDHLVEFTQRTMNQTIDKAFADPVFVASIRRKPVSLSKSAADRLKELETLRRDGLVSEVEYETKRVEILNRL